MIKSLLVAISTYSIFPVPQFEWRKEHMKYSICFFPIVGIFIAILDAAFYYIFRYSSVSVFFTACILTILPLIVSGGIHLDGFMDTSDALASHAPNERKLEIMNDPNIGAFAVIYAIIYIVLELAFMYELLRQNAIMIIAPSYILSRALSGYMALKLPKARKGGMLDSLLNENTNKKSKFVVITISLFSSLLMITINPLIASGALTSALLWCIIYKHIALKNFDGVTGDTAGFFLQLCELFMLFGAFIFSNIGAII